LIRIAAIIMMMLGVVVARPSHAMASSACVSVQTALIHLRSEAAADALLQAPGMDATLLAPPTLVDLNGDGLDDRIYIADAAGRIWRIDLDNTAPAEDRAKAVLFADLSPQGNRGFIAAPDVALHQQAGAAPWLSIAIGSYSTALPADNRFYVLRDTAWLPSSLSEASDADTPLPLRDADLLAADATIGLGDLANDPALRGYYLPLDAEQVFAASLTINGVVVFTTAPPSIGCAALSTPTQIQVRAIDATNAAPALDMNADGLTLRNPHAANSTVRIATAQDQTPSQSEAPNNRLLLRCLIDAEPIPGCQLDTRPHRQYWLREDAD
jgi:hypothetical protein